MPPAATHSLAHSVRLDDLPTLLGPYAVTAPVYVYVTGCGRLTATRLPLKEEELILVLSPRGSVPRWEA